MDTISITLIVGIITILGFLYTYVKDRFQQGRDIGSLEQRVRALENDKQILLELSQILTETRMTITRLEQKVDTWISAQ